MAVLPPETPSAEPALDQDQVVILEPATWALLQKPA